MQEHPTDTNTSSHKENEIKPEELVSVVTTSIGERGITRVDGGEDYEEGGLLRL